MQNQKPSVVKLPSVISMQHKTLLTNFYNERELRLNNNRKRLSSTDPSIDQRSVERFTTMRQDSKYSAAVSSIYEPQNTKNTFKLFKMLCWCFIKKAQVEVAPESNSKYVLKDQDVTREVTPN